MRPPIASTRRRVMASPSPHPPCRRRTRGGLLELGEQALERLGRNAKAGILTEKRKIVSPFPAARSRQARCGTVTTTPPGR